MPATLAISPDGEIIYHRLKNTAHILVVGPLTPERPGPARLFCWKCGCACSPGG